MGYSSYGSKESDTIVTNTFIYIYIYILFKKIFIFNKVYHRILKTVPCAIQKDLIVSASLLILGSGRSLGEGDGNPLQYSCLENSMDRETWWAIVHGVTKSQTSLSD